MDLFYKGILLGVSIFFFSILLDIFLCPIDIKKLLNNNYDLLMEGYSLSFINLCIITPLLYNNIVPFFVDYKNTTFSLGHFFLMVLFQNIGYYLAHFHMHNGLYWIHKFHHKYNDIVIPSSAFSVSIYEFLYAYILPLLFGAFIIYPSDTSFLCSVGLISLSNIIIHTPILKFVKFPKLLVSTSDHLNHHKHQHKNYAAPILALDRFVEFVKKK
jgi:sterol desaturase/sphingolipid hydroxylase (fatty acid hydroxylase superfamily)